MSFTLLSVIIILSGALIVFRQVRVGLKVGLMRSATRLALFLLSAVLNFFLTKYIVVSPAGTAAFNEELGTLTALSYPVIALPSTAIMFVALYYIFKSITKLTGLPFEEILSDKLKEKSK